MEHSITSATGSAFESTPWHAVQAAARGYAAEGRMIARWPRWARRLTLVTTISVVIAAMLSVPGIRIPILRSAGWALVASDAIESADIIVISIGADGAGVLEAADLVHGGIATRVAVFADPPDSIDREFIRRGLAYEDTAARSTRQLQALGVAAIEHIPRVVAGTEAEGDVLPGWCDQHRFQSIVVVSTADHSRRLRRILHRSLKNHQTKVMVRPARYSSFDPDRWWETRGGIRSEIIELQKLLLDFIRHPLFTENPLVCAPRPDLRDVRLIDSPHAHVRGLAAVRRVRATDDFPRPGFVPKVIADAKLHGEKSLLGSRGGGRGSWPSESRSRFFGRLATSALPDGVAWVIRRTMMDLTRTKSARWI